MATLYIITGPAGVGKSTISNNLANKLPKSVLLEGDDFYHQVVGGYVSPWKDGNHLDVFWQVCTDTINDYLSYDYDVIFNYIVDKEDLLNLQEKIKANIKFIVLLSTEKTLLERDKQRPKDCQMKDRCLVLLNNFLNQNFNDTNIIYTDDLSVEEITKTIIEKERFLLDKEK